MLGIPILTQVSPKPCRRHPSSFLFQDRQLRAGLGLVSEVEAVLAGSPDSVWGLLNLVRLVCGPQALQGAGGRSGSAGRVRGAEAANR